MSSIQKVLSIASAEIGYSRWNDPEAGTKYGRYYANQLGKGAYFATSGVPYCAMFVTWVFDRAGILSAIPGGAFAYVPYGINAARNAGRLISKTSAQAGDIICFDWDGDGVADHVGIVEANRGSYVQTIEGNTSSGAGGSQSNGGGVYRRARAWSDVCAAIRPAYDNASSTTAPSASAGLAEDGYWGQETSKALQRYFGTTLDGVISSQDQAHRARLAACTGGWEFVANPEGSRVIVAIQRKLGIDADGIVGPNTINALSARYGIQGDGKLDAESITVKAMQQALNKGRF